MNLETNPELFAEILKRIDTDLHIEPAFVEKDYYATKLLKSIAEAEPEIVFKGGTSLSKCHKVLSRFSEDIDLSHAYKIHPSQIIRKHIFASILAFENDLILQNRKDIHSRRDFNRYQFSYPCRTTTAHIKQYIIVETSLSIPSFPVEVLPADTFIHEYLKSTGYTSIIQQYGLEPFNVHVQSIERTFIDKIFALCDYALQERTHEHSRHLYDLYKIYPHLELNDDLRHLFEDVRCVRAPLSLCPSAQAGFDLADELEHLLHDHVYEKDFNEITSQLLFEKVLYEEAVTVLPMIIAFLRQ